MRRATVLTSMLLLSTLSSWSPAEVAGQLGQDEASRLSLEARAGVTFPLGDFSDELSSGIGVAILGLYGISNELSVYGGLSRASFESGLHRSDFLGGDLASTVVSSGLDAGLVVRLTGSNVDPWFRAGLVLHRLGFALHFPGAERISFNTDRRVGLDAGGGLEIPLSSRVVISPALRYTGYAVRLEDPRVPESLNVNALLVDIGLRYNF